MELIILAFDVYEAASCVDGHDVVTSLAAARADAFVALGDWVALARLALGLARCPALRFTFQLMLQHRQLELLLVQRPAARQVRSVIA